MTEPLYTAKGENGDLEVYDDHIHISRSGLVKTILSSGHGDKDIRIDDITGIELSLGYIQFSEEGFKTDDASLFSAPQDANTILFGERHREGFEEAKELVDELRFNSTDGSEGTDGETEYDLLRKQFAKGEITEKEYQDRLSILEGTE